MNGKRALWPVGWHATGMPIQSSSDKLRAEIEKFGSQFERYEEEDAAASVSAPGPNATREDVTKFTTSKSKANAKTAKLKYQFQIMQSMGIPKEEIYKFADPHYWLKFFPQLCTEHMASLGFRIGKTHTARWKRTGMGMSMS